MKEHVQPLENENTFNEKYDFHSLLLRPWPFIKKVVLTIKFTFNNSSKFMTNPLINSITVFYSSIPTTSFLPHQKLSIRTQVTAPQTFRTVRTVIPTSRKAEPRLNWQLHVHVGAIATITTATAYMPCLALHYCYHVSNLSNARGHFLSHQIWSVTDEQTENQSL